MSEKLNLSDVDLSSKEKLNYVYKSTATLAWICVIFSLFIFILFAILPYEENKDFMDYKKSNWIIYISIIGVFFIIFAIILGLGRSYSKLINSTINLVDSMTAMYSGSAYKNSLSEAMKDIVGRDNKVNDDDYQEDLNDVVGEFNNNTMNDLRGRLNNLTTNETTPQN